MLGAIIGDVLGSTFEFYPMKTKKFELLEKNSHFTDDTVMTVAVADSIMNGEPYVESLQKWGRKYSRAGYGSWFNGGKNGSDRKFFNNISKSGGRHLHHTIIPSCSKSYRKQAFTHCKSYCLHI